jgi:hypothetical protein
MVTMVITYLVVAVGILTILTVLKRKPFLCDRCRYMTKRSKNTCVNCNMCSLFNCYAEVDECKYFEDWGERK